MLVLDDALIGAAAFWLSVPLRPGFIVSVQYLFLATVLAIVSRPKASSLVAGMLERMGADPPLVRVARRKVALVPTPPGSTQIVYSR